MRHTLQIPVTYIRTHLDRVWIFPSGWLKLEVHKLTSQEPCT